MSYMMKSILYFLGGFFLGYVAVVLLSATLLGNQISLMPIVPKPPETQQETTTDVPTIQVDDAGRNFTISFPPGAIWSCTIFKMVKPMYPEGDSNFPDGRYAPRHCWNLGTELTFYEDDWAYICQPSPDRTSCTPYNEDWEVWADVQHEGPDGQPLDPVSTNVLQIHY